MNLIPTSETLSITVTPDMTHQIVEVPFRLPEKVVHLHVSLTKSVSSSVIDLGLKSPECVWGWSGGMRSEFTIGLNNATPGYQMGPLEKGEWAILLGLYRLPTDPVTLSIEIERSQYTPQWIKGDLHLHSTHSDGVWSLEELSREAEDQGLDYIALTDHNTTSQNQGLHLATHLILVPGMEWTTYQGHANVWGISDPWPDWRVASDAEIEAKRKDVTARGGVVSINHPFDDFDPGIHWAWSKEGFAAIEIWNGPWRPGNQAALNWWQQQLERGEHIVAVGGSDTHGPNDVGVHVGHPTTWVWSEDRTSESIVEGIRRGYVFITESPDGPSLTQGPITTPCHPGDVIPIRVTGLATDDRIRLVGDQGMLYESQVQERTWEHEWRIQSEKFLRLEVHRYHQEWDFWMPVLLTNPLYRQPIDSD